MLLESVGTLLELEVELAVPLAWLASSWALAELFIDTVFGCLEQSMSRGEKIEVRATHPSYPYTQRLFVLAKHSPHPDNPPQ
jgi:hypothetical protein